MAWESDGAALATRTRATGGSPSAKGLPPMMSPRMAPAAQVEVASRDVQRLVGPVKVVPKGFAQLTLRREVVKDLRHSGDPALGVRYRRGVQFRPVAVRGHRIPLKAPTPIGQLHLDLPPLGVCAFAALDRLQQHRNVRK